MKCPNCNGHGRGLVSKTRQCDRSIEKYSVEEQCGLCKGSGRVKVVAEWYVDAKTTTFDCSSCNGRGYTLQSVAVGKYPSGQTAYRDKQIKCEKCKGKGKIVEKTPGHWEYSYEADLRYH